MKLVFVHDDPTLANCGALYKQLAKDQQQHILTASPESITLYDISIRIQDAIKGQPALVIINQYITCADRDFCLPEHSAGIALIKFLRMMGVGAHIILVGPFADEIFSLIEKDPAHAILGSGGISFEKYLYHCVSFQLSALEAKAKNQASDQNRISSYLTSGFTLPASDRHNWANWWGIVQLTDVHRSIYPHEAEFANGGRYPATIDAQLKSLNSRQALYLYGHSISYENIIDDTAIEQLAKQKPRLVHDIQRLKEQIWGKEKPATKKPEYWHDYLQGMRNTIAEYTRTNTFFVKSWFEDQIRLTLEAIESGKVLLSAKQKELNKIEQSIERLKCGKIYADKSFKDQMVSYRLKSEGPIRIIQIDDNANKGWSEIFQRIVYGNDEAGDHFTVFHESDMDLGEFYKEIRSAIKKTDPHLIMLDLRLQQEEGIYRDVESLSGAKVLAFIRKDFPGLPIVMTTASNKTWSYQALLDLGADAYWIKEGIDLAIGLNEQERTQQSLENYGELVKIIFALSSEDYQFLKRFGNKVIEMAAQQHLRTWWWQAYKSLKAQRSNGRPGQRDSSDYFSVKSNFTGIFDMLLDGINIYRRCLQQEVLRMGSIFHFHGEAHLFRSQVVNRLAGIIEAIHFGGEDYFDGALIGRPNFEPAVNDNRQDHVGWLLYQYRNNASHFSSMTACEFRHIRSFIAGLLAWLDQESLEYIGLDKMGRYEQEAARRCPWWQIDDKKDIVDFFEAILRGANYELSYQKILKPISYANEEKN